MARRDQKLSKIDDHKQNPWNLPVPQFIEQLYGKRLRKKRSDVVLSIQGREARRGKKGVAAVL